jgi:hypothetical protein
MTTGEQRDEDRADDLALTKHDAPGLLFQALKGRGERTPFCIVGRPG